MARMIMIGRGGIVDAERIVMIASIRSEPIKRLLNNLPDERLINLTYGYPRETLLFFDNGLMAIASQTIEMFTDVFHIERVNFHEQSSDDFIQ